MVLRANLRWKTVVTLKEMGCGGTSVRSGAWEMDDECEIIQN